MDCTFFEVYIILGNVCKNFKGMLKRLGVIQISLQHKNISLTFNNMNNRVSVFES